MWSRLEAYPHLGATPPTTAFDYSLTTGLMAATAAAVVVVVTGMGVVVAVLRGGFIQACRLGRPSPSPTRLIHSTISEYRGVWDGGAFSGF